MKLSRTSNNVSWATGPALCKVVLFSEDQSPSLINEDYKRANYGKDKHELLVPPGFENCKKQKIQHCPVPSIRWRVPPKIHLNCEWKVATGEESQESRIQTSAAQTRCDDNTPTIIPSQEATQNQSASLSAVAAVASAFAAMKTQNEARLIDIDLLKAIFSDPEMVSKLLASSQSKRRSCDEEPVADNGRVMESYVKHLVREHGQHREPKQIGNGHYIKQRKLETRKRKHCAYFMTKTGCRNGNKCTFQHGIS